MKARAKKPRMFSESAKQKRLRRLKPGQKKADQKISEMRNLGPAVEKDFNAAGIFKASEIRKLGEKKAFMKMLDGRLKIGRSAKCCNALYLYSIYGAIHDCDWREVPEAKKREFKAFTEKLRKSGKYE